MTKETSNSETGGFIGNLKAVNQGWHQECSNGGADSFDEGAKIQFSEHYKCQQSPKHRLSPSNRRARML